MYNHTLEQAKHHTLRYLLDYLLVGGELLHVSPTAEYALVDGTIVSGTTYKEIVDFAYTLHKNHPSRITKERTIEIYINNAAYQFLRNGSCAPLMEINPETNTLQAHIGHGYYLSEEEIGELMFNAVDLSQQLAIELNLM